MPMENAHRGHIFLSYKSSDKERVRPLVELLEGKGFKVWWDRKIPPGKTFDEVIEEALAAAGCLVVVWTADAVASDWVKTEAAEGVKRGILVPVLIDDVLPPLEFRRIQAAKLTDLPRPPEDPDVQELFASVSRTMEREARRRGPGRKEPSWMSSRPALPVTAAPAGAGGAGAGGSRIRLFGGRRQALLAAAGVALLALAAVPIYRALFPHPGTEIETPAAAGPMTFIGVRSGDSEAEEADEKVIHYLRSHASLDLSKAFYNYETVVDKLAGWDRADGAFLARTTPYVYVAAEMLGADIEILGTYQSRATQSTTYYSYFVVNRRDFASPPTLDDVVSYVKADPGRRRRFIYHSKFSTSSYFLPSLFLRRHQIFNMERSTKSLVAIRSEREGDSSSNLVRSVARGTADLAAVWDGTKAKFEPGGAEFAETGSKVYFVRIDTPLPNDLLVCSGFLDKATKERLRSAIAAMEGSAGEHVDVGDFLYWREWIGAVDAREALAALRYAAAAPPTPVTVEITSADPGHPVPEAYLEAARQAVRLSGTEFVVFDPDFHQHADFLWTLKVVHDGALQLTSKVKGLSNSSLKQEHWISFAGGEELTGRISDFIHSKMHRLRYLWPYAADKPTLIRDFGFSVPVGTRVVAQRVVWLNPERNEITEEGAFETAVAGADFNKLALAAADFAGVGGFEVDPMSNAAYRVVVVRPSRESLLLRILSYLLVALLVLAAVGAVADLWRRSSRATARPGQEGEEERAHGVLAGWRKARAA
jgi:ABC-type phosphate/phosphonate transport system substrate-binding protein